MSLAGHALAEAYVMMKLHKQKMEELQDTKEKEERGNKLKKMDTPSSVSDEVKRCGCCSFLSLSKNGCCGKNSKTRDHTQKTSRDLGD